MAAIDDIALQGPLDPAPLARWLEHLLVGFLVVQVVAAATAGLAAMVANGSGGRRSAVDRLDDLASLADLIALLVCAVPFLKWTYRVVRNARLADAGLTVSPGWAIGWYFVPVLNLWRPYGSLRTVWLSEARAQSRPYDLPGAFPLWWWLWILTCVLGRVSSHASDADTSDAKMAFAAIDAVAYGLGVPMTLALMAVIRRLTALQAARLSAPPA